MKYYGKKHLKKTVDKYKCNWLTKENNNKELLRIKCQGTDLQIYEGSHIIHWRVRYLHALYEGLCVSLLTRHRVFRLINGEQDCVGLERLLSISHSTPANTSYHGSIAEMHQCIPCPQQSYTAGAWGNTATLWAL